MMILTEKECIVFVLSLICARSTILDAEHERTRVLRTIPFRSSGCVRVVDRVEDAFVIGL